MKPESLWELILDRSGISVSVVTLDRLSRFQEWLATEAIEGGGLASGERERLADRHIGDSLLFLGEFGGRGPILDIGAGVGLPGIPIACSLPGTTVTCLDRSGRRVDLARRATRILGLDNVTVRQGEIERFRETFPVVVSRAAIPPPRLASILPRLLEPGGIAVIGGSWTEPPRYPGFETREIGQEILGRPVWILKMATT